MSHHLTRLLPWLSGLMLTACGDETNDSASAPAPPAKAKAAPAQIQSPVDEVFGMFYALTLEHALRKHHPGGKFSLTHWDSGHNGLPLPEALLERILSGAKEFRPLYVPFKRLQKPPHRPEGGFVKEPLRDSLDGQEVFLYAFESLDWIAPETVRVEYSRFRVSGDLMWQPITFKQEGRDWKLVDKDNDFRLDDIHKPKGSYRMTESKSLPAPKQSIKEFPKTDKEAPKPGQ